jgi:putative membrane protein
MKFTSLALVATFLASTAYAAEKPSHAFLKKAIEGNFAEVEMGKLAQQNGQNDNVKKFGQTLIDDRSAANQKAMDAARSMGVTPPDGPNAKQRPITTRCRKCLGRNSIANSRPTGDGSRKGHRGVQEGRQAGRCRRRVCQRPD